MDEAALKRARQAAGEAAAERVESRMTVGLGTGDSAAHALRALARRGLTGLRCVPTSVRTAELARSLGLTLIELDQLPPAADTAPAIDLTIDGADEIDPSLRLIKGAGGALLREKLVAHASRRLVIVADTTKVVSRLGERRLLPVEIVPFGVPQTVARLQAAFPGAALRRRSPPVPGDGDAEPYVTDGGNRLVDVPLPGGAGAHGPEELHRRLKLMLGVIETGFFLVEAHAALIGDAHGAVQELRRGPA